MHYKCKGAYMRTIITAAAVKGLRSNVALIVSIAAAVSEFHASDDSKSAKGRNAMRRLGMFALKRIIKDDAKVPFANVDGMLGFINTQRQALENALKSCQTESTFYDACTVEAYKSIVRKGLEAVDSFRANWKDATAKAA
jgi:hypothetical protein